MIKRKIVRWFVRMTDGWNNEFHNEIEQRVHAEHKRIFPIDRDDPSPESSEKTSARIDDMRSFYYGRMTMTATLLIGMASFVVAAVALVVAIVALAHPDSASSGQSTEGANQAGLFASMTPIVLGLLAAYATAILAEDYRRFRDCQSLAASLYGELQAHLEGFAIGLPTLKEIQKHLDGGVPLKFMPQIKPPGDPVYEAAVAKLGLLGPRASRDVAYTYQNMKAFRAGYAYIAESYKEVEQFALAGMLKSTTKAAENATARGSEALVQLNRLAQAKYKIFQRAEPIADEP